MMSRALVAAGDDAVRRRLRQLVQAQGLEVFEATNARGARLTAGTQPLSVAIVAGPLDGGGDAALVDFLAVVCPRVPQLLIGEALHRLGRDNTTLLPIDFGDEAFAAALRAHCPDLARTAYGEPGSPAPEPESPAAPSQDPMEILAGQLVTLKRVYIQGLPERLRTLRAAVADAPRDAAARAEARMVAHRIQGTAGTHGLRELGEKAGAVEATIAELPEPEEPPSSTWDDVARRVDELVAEMARVIEAAQSERREQGHNGGEGK